MSAPTALTHHRHITLLTCIITPIRTTPTALRLSAAQTQATQADRRATSSDRKLLLKKLMETDQKRRRIKWLKTFRYCKDAAFETFYPLTAAVSNPPCLSSGKCKRTCRFLRMAGYMNY
ncbi:hypothetical protein CHS0354_034465 [Potamilus streckersoni]|uniref:Uncharacterized protein n=1 Tax=Potamilus streckersoni TaxID=2493646 RepID=A0AAE0TB60_9BIVA|nr:hypothetical protein CHS0354_034465 [Potamilus streckersoni]